MFHSVSESIQYGDLYYLAFPVAVVILLLFLQGRRRLFVIPALLLAIAIYNPLFYIIWIKLGLYAYWRVLWLIPVIPLCAAVPPAITEKLRSIPLRMLITVLCIAAYMIGGTFLYRYSRYGEIGSSDGGTFLVPAANAEKVPESVGQIADWLLARDENPRVIAEPRVSTYLRQYSAKITQLYGRDVDGYIYSEISSEARAVHSILSSPEGDLSAVAKVMLNDDYRFLILNDSDPQRKQSLTDNGFTLEERFGNFGIYSVQGVPTLKKERNSLGQVVTVTSLDENGNPVNNEEGIATVHYDYDRYGNIIRLFQTDVNGNGVLNGDNVAGWERTYDAKEHLLREQYLDENGLPCIQSAGYAAIEQKFDIAGNLIRRSYLDEKGAPCQRIDGFSEARWSKDDDSSAWNLNLYSLNGEPIPLDGINLAKDIQNDGWSAWMRPSYNKVNFIINIGCMNLGEKKAGDCYTCQFDIEFSGVTECQDTEFRFLTLGTADDDWTIGNVWDGNLIHLHEAPEDGIYHFVSTRSISEASANVSTFNIGFRCDNWASGSFRVRNIKIEKGDTATPWSPGI